MQSKETNTNDNETDADNENNKRQQRDSATQTVKKDHNSHKKPKDKPAYEQRAGSETGHRLNVAIIGDSMVKHLNPSKLRKGTKHNINVQTFSGANVADMRYYVKPAISRSPDYLLLHVGTNDLKQQTPQQIAGSISTLCQEIVKESPNTKIVLSKVITRSDDSSLDSKIKELNCKLSQ
ncbi:Scavenger receptor cysteine-rich type 1 M130, partial [Paramuricea clavata]